jgi:hypothetical protein
MITDLGQVTGSDPGFTDHVGEDYAPAAGSPLIDQAVALHPARLPDHVPVLHYMKHQSTAPRVTAGSAPDLGAYEQGGVVGVDDPPPGSGGAGDAGLALRATPNPFTGACVVELIGGVVTGADLDVFDVTGRLRARVSPVAPGRWILRAGPALVPGTYLVRLGSLARRVTLLP